MRIPLCAIPASLPSSFLFHPSSFPCLLLLAVTVASLPEIACGQGSSYGMFGSRTMGQGLGASGSSGFGLDLGSGSGSGANTVGQITGSERFLRSNRQASQFVGGSSQQVLSVMQPFSAAGNSTVNPTQGLQAMRYGAGDEQPPATTLPPFRATLSVDFDHPSISPEVALGSLSKRLGGTLRIKRQKPIQVTLQGSTVILRGEVATDHDRLLAEQLVRLEPGIWAVQNELAVTKPSPEKSAGRSSSRRSTSPSSAPMLGSPNPRGS